MVDLLVVLEGPRDREVIRAVLGRPAALGIRQITFQCVQRSSAVCAQGPDIARQQRNRFRYVICLWDHQGSGQGKTPARAQGEVQAQLNRNTLKGCSKALVIDPELEIWLWQDQAAIVNVLGVGMNQLWQSLNAWQQAQFPTQTVRALIRQFPKEALEEVIRQAGEKPSAALYGRIAAKANLQLWGSVPSFKLFRRTLRRWFR